MRRAFTAPPDDCRCTFDITLSGDHSAARCMRRAVSGTYCKQHAQIMEESSTVLKPFAYINVANASTGTLRACMEAYYGPKHKKLGKTGMVRHLGEININWIVRSARDFQGYTERRIVETPKGSMICFDYRGTWEGRYVQHGAVLSKRHHKFSRLLVRKYTKGNMTAALNEFINEL